MTEESVDTVDIAIVGAGPVGMTLALALAEGPFSVVLIDSRGRGAWRADPRALALSHGSRQLLERLGAWNVSAGTPIHSIHVSQRNGFGRTVIEARDYDLPALGYVMRYRDLAATLDARIDGVRLLNDCALVDLTVGRETTEIRLACSDATRRVAARVIVHAEGTPGNEDSVTIDDYRCLLYTCRWG